MMMARLPRPLRRALRRIGRCPKCMRTSFVVASTAWVGTGFFCAVVESRAIGMAAFDISCALTALWFAHLARYAMRVNAREKSGAARGCAKGVRAIGECRDQWSRRRALRSFAEAFVVMAAITALPDGVLAQTNIGVRKCIGCCDDDKDACLSQKRPAAECDTLSENCAAGCQDPEKMAAYMASKRKLRG